MPLGSGPSPKAATTLAGGREPPAAPPPFCPPGELPPEPEPLPPTVWLLMTSSELLGSVPIFVAAIALVCGEICTMLVLSTM